MALDLLTSMAVFREAVERGSLAAAARAEHLSSEMASHHLRMLETRLGVRLLNRTTRRLSLTDAGRAYYTRCVGVLDEVAIAEAEAKEHQANPRGHIRLAAPLAFGTTLLGEPLARFLDAHRNVSIDVDLSERTVGLLDEGYDLALRLGELLDSGLVSRCLGCFALEVVASPAYVATHGRPRRMRDLRNHEALIYTQTAQPERWCFFGPDQRAETIEVRGRFRASDIGILIELALGGHGLLLAPSFLVNRPLSEGRLVAVLDSWRARDLPLSVLLPHRSFVPAAVRALVAFLASWFDARASENVDQ